MTTPAAAPAAPAAVAPVAAPAVAPVAAVTPPAPAPVAAPAAPIPGPVEDSLLPGDPPVAAPAVAPVVAPAAPAATPALPADPNAPKWFYSDGTPGKGAAPEWFKANKYVTVEEQAKAYNALEGRFGAFVGAPKDGKYDVKLPDGIGIELVPDHPLMADFTKWAAEHQLNQEGFSTIVGMLAQYEAAQLPNMAEAKARLGANADARLTAVAAWQKANLDPTQQAALRTAMTGHNADAVFTVVEALIGKSNQAVLPKAGADIPAPPAPTGDAYKAMMAKKGPDGKALYFTDPLHRAATEALLADMAKAQAAQQ